MSMTVEGNRADITSWTIMRGFAALAVVVFHFKKHVAYSLVSVPVIGPVLQNGDLGVDMFFILSGFVMTYVYGLPARGTKFEYRKFYIRRLARIYPVHLITLLGAFIMLSGGLMLGLINLDPGLLFRSVPIHLFLLHGIGPGSLAPTLNYPSWSVSSEMLAYLLFPVFALLYRMIRSPIPLVLAAIAMLYAIFDASSLAVIGGIRVSVEFILGMGLCLILRDFRHQTLGKVVMILGLTAFVIAVNIGTFRSLAILGLAAVISGAFIGDRGRQAIWWPRRAFIYLGQISYSIYMVHALIEAPGFKVAQIVTGAPEDGNSLFTLALLMVMTLLAAASLYHFVEQPCRRAIVAFSARWD